MVSADTPVSSGPPTPRNDLGAWHGVNQEQLGHIVLHVQVPHAIPVVVSDDPPTPRQPISNVPCMAKEPKHTTEIFKESTQLPKAVLEQAECTSRGSFDREVSHFSDIDVAWERVFNDSTSLVDVPPDQLPRSPDGFVRQGSSESIVERV
eukprot:TRINITY_DN64829_c0_g1_i1.p1 TRINITY_DN64829_c0_g1~~TRINITY_DN64829_c0_g1_i1.p1  ORF type:complete len:150 (-),score=17.49 TRINITY_DN64829_c0_g1_i1:86-535(-)